MENIIILHDIEGIEIYINPQHILWYKGFMNGGTTLTQVELRDRYEVIVTEKPVEVTDILRSVGVGIYRKVNTTSDPFYK